MNKQKLVLMASAFFGEFCEKRSEELYARTVRYVCKSDKILDIGIGSGHVTNKYISNGYKVTPLDVVDLSVFDKITPQIYNGTKLPFKDNGFDVSLLINVLHHTTNPESLLVEARRVSDTIIIVEEVYKNTFQKYMTYIMDSVTNLEFLGHPHGNKSDLQWKKNFVDNNLALADVKYYPFWKFFLSAVYVVDKN